MIEFGERVLDAYDRGEISRRDAILAVAGLAMSGAVPVSAQTEADPTYRAVGLNHLALRVSDVARSRDFYIEHFGASAIRDMSPNGPCFLRIGVHYLGLFPTTTPALDHFCFTVEGYDPDQAMSKLEAAGLTPRREEDRVYFSDPDGLQIQLDSRFGSWPGKVPEGIA